MGPLMPPPGPEDEPFLESGREHYAAYLIRRHPTFSSKRIERRIQGDMSMPGIRATILVLERYNQVPLAINAELGDGTVPQWFEIDDLFPWDHPTARR